MRRFLVRFSRLESFVHTRSSAGFTTTTSGFKFSVHTGSLHQQIDADMQFHAFLNELSGNPLIGETTAPHWPYLRRVMGEVLRDDAQMPQTILQDTWRSSTRSSLAMARK